MHLKSAAGSALVIALALGSFPLAQAASLTGSATGQAAAAVDAVNSATGNVNVNGSATGSTGSADVSGDVDLDTSVSTDASGVTSLTSGAAVMTEADLTAYTQAVLSRESGSVSGSAQTNGSATASGGEGSASGNVSGSADASVQGAYVSDVAYADDGMTVTFRQPARFLGFIPTTVNATAEVSNSGEVSLSYPWYSFLMSTHRAEIMAALEARIASVMGAAEVTGSADAAADAAAMGSTTAAGALSASAAADASVSGSLSPRVRAQLLDEVRAVVHEIQADGSLMADLSGSADIAR